jgi:hypothetical protein
MAIDCNCMVLTDGTGYLSHYVALKITGKLETTDYHVFVPELDRQIKTYGKINMLLELVDFHGWTAGAAWEDTKFGVRHFNDLKRLAFVGDEKWERGLAFFSKVFTTASVRCFDITEKDLAIDWIGSGD